jgi:hypothetical protein
MSWAQLLTDKTVTSLPATKPELDNPPMSFGSESVGPPHHTIFRTGLSQWRQYETWLGPLEEALGE